MSAEQTAERRMPRSLGAGRSGICPHATETIRCANPAGAGTVHPGTGYCRVHDQPAAPVRHVCPDPVPQVVFREAPYWDGKGFQDTAGLPAEAFEGYDERGGEAAA